MGDQIEIPNRIKAFHFFVSFEEPFERGWDQYKTIFQLFPNLTEYITLEEEDDDDQITAFEEAMELELISPYNRNIWEERVAYLRLQGIEMISRNQITKKRRKYRKRARWG